MVPSEGVSEIGRKEGIRDAGDEEDELRGDEGDRDQNESERESEREDERIYIRIR